MNFFGFHCHLLHWTEKLTNTKESDIYLHSHLHFAASYGLWCFLNFSVGILSQSIKSRKRGILQKFQSEVPALNVFWTWKKKNSINVKSTLCCLDETQFWLVLFTNSILRTWVHPDIPQKSLVFPRKTGWQLWTAPVKVTFSQTMSFLFWAEQAIQNIVVTKDFH